MASALYDLARQKFLEGGIAWLSDTIKGILIDTSQYTVNLATDEFLDDVPSGARVAVSDALIGKTSTAGVADATDLSFAEVSGAQCAAMVLYKHTGTEGTSPLISYHDSGVGLPIIPNGGDVTVVFSSDTARIFKL